MIIALAGYVIAKRSKDGETIPMWQLILFSIGIFVLAFIVQYGEGSSLIQIQNISDKDLTIMCRALEGVNKDDSLNKRVD